MVDVMKLSAALGFELRQQSKGGPWRIYWPSGDSRFASDAEICMWFLLMEGRKLGCAKRAPRKRLGKTIMELKEEGR